MFKSALALIEKKVLAKAALRRSVRVQLDITNACNLACSHCYHSNHSDRGSIPTEQWFRILDQIDKFTKLYSYEPQFVICGGEPMTSHKLTAILDRIFEKWPTTSATLLTNGTVTPQKILSYLRGKNIILQVSLDGPDAARHDSVRGQGSFQKSLAGIRKFQSEGLPVQTLSILSLRTMPWIGEFFATAKKTEVTCQNFTRLIPIGEGAKLANNGADRPLEPIELKEAYTQIILESAYSGVLTNTYQPLFGLIDPAFGSKGRFGLGDIAVDYKGQLKISSRSDYSVGSLLEHDLEDLYLNHPIMKALQDGQIQGCKNCKFFSACGGDRNASYAASGSFLEKDPGCWLT